MDTSLFVVEKKIKDFWSALYAMNIDYHISINLVTQGENCFVWN